MQLILKIIFFMLIFSNTSNAQSKFQSLIEYQNSNIIKPSVKTAPFVINSIQTFNGEISNKFLLAWQLKKLWYRKDDYSIFLVEKHSNTEYATIDLETGKSLGLAKKNTIKQIKPNSGVRRLIGSALVTSQLNSSILINRISSLDSIGRNPKAIHLQPLRNAILKESDTNLKIQMERLERILSVKFEINEVKRIEAIRSFDNDLSLDVRASLNPILNTTLELSKSPPKQGTYAQIIDMKNPSKFNRYQAYDMIVKEGWAIKYITSEMKRSSLIENIKDGEVSGIKIKNLHTNLSRDLAYSRLVNSDLAPKDVTESQIQSVIDRTFFYEKYIEKSPNVILATQQTLNKIKTKVYIARGIDLFLDALSLASIFFLAAIGLAITFGVMGVINMAHGEFIMMGAYTGYIVQQYIPNYTISIILALPIAFAVTFFAGILMERLIIRHLYHRPLETLLATFGVSIALQQLAKNIFGTQARPLTSPDWLGGSMIINDVISISWIRVAILCLSIIFFALLWFTLNKTRLGLETRAVTQNPQMAASMGINPHKINMLTFGLGSGIAGIAGVAIGLFAKVTSELGNDYIVQSFMTVVVGGVGNIWGTLAGAAMIGFLQKSIEWFNPSNTLAAQTFMIVFIIIFIQFRPRGIIALKGRAAGD
ncbi:urea ABC transporter permease subunit UrtB [Amylibacter sp.]|nr:urea ABC transporter permease subunit UrtB [Amylibacter sp.]